MDALAAAVAAAVFLALVAQRRQPKVTRVGLVLLLLEGPVAVVERGLWEVLASMPALAETEETEEAD